MNAVRALQQAKSLPVDSERYINMATVKALGLHGIGSTSVVTDNEATRGMVRQVRFLVTVEEIVG